MVTAASDAHMNGYAMLVVINSDGGNQRITVNIPRAVLRAGHAGG